VVGAINCCRASNHDIVVWNYGAGERDNNHSAILQDVTLNATRDALDPNNTVLATKNGSNPLDLQFLSQINTLYGNNYNCFTKNPLRWLFDRVARLFDVTVREP
jgi:hypothetical protein